MYRRFVVHGVRMVRMTALLALGALLGVAASAQDRGCALVLMHGKWGSPKSLVGFASRVDAVCATTLLEMPWSRRREYDQPYPVALQEIQAQVKALRQQGFQRVLVGGQSFGANAALAYMAYIGDADGVVALAPGHTPELMYSRGIGKTAVDQVRTLVADGKGDERIAMEDLNQGQRRTITMAASTLLSYFDPQGMGNMPGSTAGFLKAVPLLWVVGTADPLYAAGASYAYDKAPAHPKSKYLVVDAGHFDTPQVAVAGVADWLKTLE